MLLPICLLKCWLYVYILLNICPAFMSICLPFLLYVCGFFSKDHAYTSIEDSMAIGDPKVPNIVFSRLLPTYAYVPIDILFCQITTFITLQLIDFIKIYQLKATQTLMNVVI